VLLRSRVVQGDRALVDARRKDPVSNRRRIMRSYGQRRHGGLRTSAEIPHEIHCLDDRVRFLDSHGTADVVLGAVRCSL
jgi:hypothetical protein